MAANDLADLRERTRNFLSPRTNDSSWPERLVDSAIRLALRDYTDYGPIREKNFTVTTAGFEQDVSGVSAILYQIVNVTYPWDAANASPFYKNQTVWREVRNQVIIMEKGQNVMDPALNDIIRLRYREAHTITDLDSATATTLDGPDITPFTVGAAGKACGLRAMDLSEDPTAAADAIVTLNERATVYMAEFARFLSRDALMSGQLPTWQQIGLENTQALRIGPNNVSARRG